MYRIVLYLCLSVFILVGCDAVSGPQLTIMNDTDEDVCFLYVSLSSDDEWGDDRLGVEILEVGETISIHLEVATYDILAEPCGSDDDIAYFEIDVNEDINLSLARD